MYHFFVIRTVKSFKELICWRSQEIRFGDNDTLSAIAAGMVKADYLFLMTDVDCLYTDNPRTNPLAEPVWQCNDIDALREKSMYCVVLMGIAVSYL
jgi:glutamate 5-kinase